MVWTSDFILMYGYWRLKIIQYYYGKGKTIMHVYFKIFNANFLQEFIFLSCKASIHRNFPSFPNLHIQYQFQSCSIYIKSSDLYQSILKKFDEIKHFDIFFALTKFDFARISYQIQKHLFNFSEHFQAKLTCIFPFNLLLRVSNVTFIHQINCLKIMQ